MVRHAKGTETAVVHRDFDRALGEIIVTDPETGAQKAQKLARFDLIPQKPLWLLAEHYGRGAQKYADRNWEGGYAWSLSFDSLNHHLNQFWDGEDIDPTNGALHMIAVAWHALALVEFYYTHPEKDNRPNANT
jgi:hypothetical protein